MFKPINIKLLFPVLAAALLLAACDKDKGKDEAGNTALLSADDTILKYVPADTPYVLASVQPLPDDLLDKLEPKIDRILRSYQTILREVVKTKQAESGAEDADSEGARKVEALVDEVSTLLSIEGLRAAGVARDATGAIYGNGLLPVIRWELTDGALFDAAISRLEEKGGSKMPVAAVEGGAYRYVDIDRLRLVIAILDNQAVITLVPAGFDAKQTAAAIGLVPPSRSIADSGKLQSVAAKYGFSPQYSGFIDLQAIAGIFTEPQTGPNAELLAMWMKDAPPLSDLCKAEIREMAGIAPRIALGYTAVSDARIDSNVVIELRKDIADGLTPLAAAVPGLGGDEGGLLSFGMSVDVDAARKFAEARIDAIEADPYECELFAGLQQGAAGAREGLKQPLPPMAYGFKGFLAVIDDVEGLDIASQTPPTSVDGRFLLAMDNAQSLVAMGAMFSPDLANLNLQPDGKPVPLSLPQLQAMGMSAFAALTESALALAVGDGGDAKLGAMLSAEVAETLPIMSFSVDAARYYSFVGDAIAASPPKEGQPEMSPEFKEALGEIMSAVADLYDRISADVVLTGNGVEIRSIVTLKD